MLLAILTLFSGLFLSAVSEYYSIMGLIAIFSADPMPIAIMGVALGIAKLTTTVWLKQNWNTAPTTLKTYLVSAVVILMVITSLGCFGLLSKAHSDQSLVSGDAGAKVQIIEEQINTEKENIDTARKSLKQMDDAVDQVMGRSTDVNGASKSVAIRKSQQPERSRLQANILVSQQRIAKLNETKAPLSANLRKIDSEVGPIRYIAAFIYGTTPDASLLEKAVTWVIVLIVMVFDPLAVTMLLASQYSFQLEIQRRKEVKETESDTEDLETPNVTSREDATVSSMPNFVPMPVNTTTTWTYNTVEESKVSEGEPITSSDDPVPPKSDAAFDKVSTPYEISEEDRAEIDSFIPENVETKDPVEHWNEWLDSIKDEDLQDDWIKAAEAEAIAEDAALTEFFERGREVAKRLDAGESLDGIPGVRQIEVEEAANELSTGYVQNEEQGSGGLWSKIANKTISGDEYIEILKNKKNDDI